MFEFGTHENSFLFFFNSFSDSIIHQLVFNVQVNSINLGELNSFKLSSSLTMLSNDNGINYTNNLVYTNNLIWLLNANGSI